MTQKTFTVNMHCASCLMLLQGLEELPGVEKVTGDLKKQHLTVSFDEQQLNEAAVIEAIKQEGYEATPLAEPS